jgi:hypothetical protein
MRPRLPVAMPVPSLRATSTVAAAMDASAVRDCPDGLLVAVLMPADGRP